MGKYFRPKSLVTLVILLFTLFFSPNLGLVSTVSASGAVFSLDFDDEFLYAATEKGVDIYSKKDWSLEKSVLVEMAFSNLIVDNDTIFASTLDGKVVILSKNGDVLYRIDLEPGGGSGVRDLEIDSSFIYALSPAGIVKAYDRHTLSLAEEIDIPDGSIVVITKFGDSLYLGFNDGVIAAWDTKRWLLERKFTAPTSEIGRGKGAWQLFIDNGFIYSANIDKVIRIWDREKGRYIKTIKAHDSDVMSLTGDAQYIYSGAGGGDNSIKIWTKDSQFKKRLQHHSSAVRDLKIDGNTLYSASIDGTIGVWNLNNFELIKTIGQAVEVEPPPGFMQGVRTILSRILAKETAIVAVAIGILLSLSVLLEFRSHLKKSSKQGKKLATLEFLTSYLKPGDLLLIVILGLAIIVVLGMIEPTVVFPEYKSVLRPSEYFEVFVKRGALKVIWFILPPTVVYCIISRKETSPVRRFLWTLVSLFAAIVVYMYLIT